MLSITENLEQANNTLDSISDLIHSLAPFHLFCLALLIYSYHAMERGVKLVLLSVHPVGWQSYTQTELHAKQSLLSCVSKSSSKPCYVTNRWPYSLCVICCLVCCFALYP